MLQSCKVSQWPRAQAACNACQEKVSDRQHAETDTWALDEKKSPLAHAISYLQTKIIQLNASVRNCLSSIDNVLLYSGTEWNRRPVYKRVWCTCGSSKSIELHMLAWTWYRSCSGFWNPCTFWLSETAHNSLVWTYKQCSCDRQYPAQCLRFRRIEKYAGTLWQQTWQRKWQQSYYISRDER